MREILPETVEIIGTHPLFRPQSGREGIAGMRFAICPLRTDKSEEIKRFLVENLKLQVFENRPQNTIRKWRTLRL